MGFLRNLLNGKEQEELITEEVNKEETLMEEPTLDGDGYAMLFIDFKHSVKRNKFH